MAGRVVTDQLGRTVQIPEQPKRIVSLVPSITELLFDLGMGENVVGVTRFCVHPEEARQKAENIGGTKDLKLDRIAALQPDLIIGTKEENTRRHIEQLQKDFPVWLGDPQTVEGAIDLITAVGDLCGKTAKGEQMSTQVRKAFKELQSDSDGESLNVAYLIWKDPIMVSGSRNFIDSVIATMGWNNVFAQHKNRYPAVGIKELKAIRPDLLLLSSEPYPFNQSHVDEFSEALKCRAKLVDGEMFSWYGSRMLKMPGYLQSLKKEVK